VVETETPQTVTLRVANGTVSFHRRQIAAVIRETEERNAALAASWQAARPPSPPPVPDGFAALDARLHALEERRRAAIAAQQVDSREPAAAAETRRLATQALRRDLLALHARLHTVTPASDPAAYNAMVASNNTLQAAIALRLAEQEQAHQSRLARHRAVDAYLTALRDTAAAWADARQRLARAPDSDPDAAAFLEKAEIRLRRCEADFEPLEAEARLHGRSTAVGAEINGRIWGRFLVDTGAELVSLSQVFAERAGLAADAGEPVTLRLADGSAITGRVARLDRVRIGGIEQRDVEAAILPFPPAPDVDGLLGMNVLHAFQIRTDPETGLIRLERFAPAP